MARPPSDPELKNEFSAQIKSLLSRLTAQEIATELGVQRQTVYNYRDGKNAPSPEVIRRAMEAWPDFSLSYRDRTLTLQDFRRKPIVTAKKAVQYELWDVIKKLNSESIEIEILKKESSSVQLGVRIFFRNREK
ncbi:MAG: helix-turn-helix domain-containing protein [Terriglobales bacterium]|jgi:transcriptional regulator with XRE-family HTH domain